MLVSDEATALILSDSHSISFSDIDSISVSPPHYAKSEITIEQQLSKTELTPSREVWVKPISRDAELRLELRGWCSLKQCFVENESENMFAINSYGIKGYL